MSLDDKFVIFDDGRFMTKEQVHQFLIDNSRFYFSNIDLYRNNPEKYFHRHKQFMKERAEMYLNINEVE